MMRAARVDRDVIKLSCLNEKTIEVLVLERRAREARDALRSGRDDLAREIARLRLLESDERVRQLDREALACAGDDAKTNFHATRR